MDGIVSNVVVGVLTGVASAGLSQFVFRAQRRWERKEDAYREVLEALHAMSAASDVLLTVEMEHRSLTEERRSELYGQLQAGKSTILKYADIGSLTINSEVEQVLSKLIKQLETTSNANTLFEVFDAEAAYVSAALKEIKQLALADRRVSLAWLRKPVT